MVEELGLSDRVVFTGGIPEEEKSAATCVGLIVGEWEEKESGRKRRYYHITKDGRTTLEKKKEAWNAICGAVNCILDNSNGQA